MTIPSLTVRRYLIYKSIMKRERLCLLYGPEAIHRATRRVAEEIDGDAGGEHLTLVGVLKGSFVFLADLMRLLRSPVSLDFVRISSYGRGRFPGRLRLTKDIEVSLRGRRVLIVDDVVDTGLTMNFLLRCLMGRGAASVKTCALLDKPSRRLVDVTLDYRGFTVPDRFLVGYGLDLDEKYRQLPGLYSLVDEKPPRREPPA